MNVYVARFISSYLALGSKFSFECRIFAVGVETAYPSFD
jgi:hypothetical protein